MGKVFAILGVLLLFATGAAHAAEETVRYGRFGAVVLYQRAAVPSRVVIFVSGDGGWNLGVIDMARALADLDALVVGVDITRYLKNLAQADEACSYAAADFEALSKFAQKKLGFPRYVPPVLVGYSSGATLVYAVLVQAPTGTFQGAISLGFCPDLGLAKPLCRGNGLAWSELEGRREYRFLPSRELSMPWIALQGTIDQVCESSATQDYVRQVGHAAVVLLPKVGHGFSVPRNWLPQFKEAFGRLAAAEPSPTARPAAPGAFAGREKPSSSIEGLPLVEVPGSLPGDTLAVILTGDGGWAGLDRELASILARRGVPVVGLNTLQYFWNAKSPDLAAADAEKILRHYLAKWGREKAVLIGYSFGADVLPFIASRLPRDLAERVALVVLLGPGRTAQFEFHILDWVSEGSGKKNLPILPELGKLGEMRVLCLDAEDARGSLCPTLGPGTGRVVTVKGGHHFGGDYQRIAEIILSELR